MLQSRMVGGPTAALAVALVGASAGVAQDAPGVFTVSDIPADATAADAVAARNDALRQGQQVGLDRLLRRLVPAESYDRLPAVSGLPIERYVQNFEIAGEELSSTRYLARLTVAYDPEAVRGLASRQGFPIAETPSAPILVLPLFEGPDGPRLWAEGNPWWQAWAETMDPERLVRLVLPLGDLEDMARLSVERVQAGDAAAVLGLAARYGAEDALIMSTTPLAGAAAEQTSVQLEAHRVGALDREGEPLTLSGQPGEPLEVTLAEAVRRLQASLDERWKSDHLLRYDQARAMVVEVPIQRLEDWVGIQRGLESLPEVSQVGVASFARHRVQAEIRYLGDPDGLAEAVARVGLALSQEGDSWHLQPMAGSLSRGAPASATPTSF